MSAEEAAAITVPFADVGRLLPGVMRDHGVAVVEGVVAGAELSGLVDSWQEDLRSLVDEEALTRAPEGVQHAFARFLHEGPSAFPLASSRRFTTMSGFAVDRCLCHGKFAWTVRKNQHVHQVFEALYGEGPLVTSLDVPFFTPRQTGRTDTDAYSSAHVDQNLHDSRGDLGSIDEYQGVLYAWSCNQEDDSTATVVWPQSYREADETCAYMKLMEDPASRRLGQSGQHYTLLSTMRGDGRSELRARFLEEARRVPVPAGGLLLWNSKTVHTGVERGPRLAQAVCLEPQGRRSSNQRLAKLRMAALGLPSMHWASHAIQHDCVRLRRGYLTEGRDVQARDAEHPADVILPLRSRVQPWCSTQGVWKTLRTDEGEELIGVLWEDADFEPFAELLEQCVCEEAKAVL